MFRPRHEGASVRTMPRWGAEVGGRAGWDHETATGYKDDTRIYSAKLRVRLMTVPPAAPNPPEAASSVTPRVDAGAQRSVLDIATARRAFTISRRGPTDNAIGVYYFALVSLPLKYLLCVAQKPAYPCWILCVCCSFWTLRYPAEQYYNDWHSFACQNGVRAGRIRCQTYCVIKRILCLKASNPFKSRNRMTCAWRMKRKSWPVAMTSIILPC